MLGLDTFLTSLPLLLPQNSITITTAEVHQQLPCRIKIDLNEHWEAVLFFNPSSDLDAVDVYLHLDPKVVKIVPTKNQAVNWPKTQKSARARGRGVWGGRCGLISGQRAPWEPRAHTHEKIATWQPHLRVNSM